MTHRFHLILFFFLMLAACTPKPTPGPEASSLLPTKEAVTGIVETAVPEIVEPLLTTPEPSAPSPTREVYPLTTETGDPAVDPVLAALSASDRVNLIERFAYLSTTCQTVNALGGPPACRAGEAEGTVVSVLPVLGSEGTYIHADSVDAFEGLDVAGIYAIFQNSDAVYAEELYPAGEYTILLAGAGAVPGYALRVADGKIVRLEYYFDFSAFDTILARDVSQFILEPLQ